MSKPTVIDIIEDPGLVWEGHFELASGRHSGVYWEKFRILERPDLLEEVCRPIAANFKDCGAEFIVGPSLGGMLVAYEIARQMRLTAAFAERRGSERFFREPVLLRRNCRVLIVDDVLMTGVTLDRVIEALERLGASIMGVGIIMNRAQKAPVLKYPLFCVHSMVIPDYAPGECPFCRERIPLHEAAGTT